MVDILIELQAESEEGCPFVFLTKRRYKIVKKKWHRLVEEGKSRDWENRYLLNHVLRDFKARIIAAGISTNLKINLHCLRKSWATNMANSGKVPIHTLKELGGWSHLKTCEEFYLQSSDANKERACEVLNELAGVEEAVGGKVQFSHLSALKKAGTPTPIFDSKTQFILLRITASSPKKKLRIDSEGTWNRKLKDAGWTLGVKIGKNLKWTKRKILNIWLIMRIFNSG